EAAPPAPGLRDRRPLRAGRGPAPRPRAVRSGRRERPRLRRRAGAPPGPALSAAVRVPARRPPRPGRFALPVGPTSLAGSPHRHVRRTPTTRSHAVVDIQSLLGDEAESLLTHEAKGIPRDDLNLPGPDY